MEGTEVHGRHVEKELNYLNVDKLSNNSEIWKITETAFKGRHSESVAHIKKNSIDLTRIL